MQENRLDNQTRELVSVLVSEKGKRWLQSGHPWLFESDFLRPADASLPENGSLVKVCDERGRYLGSAFYSEQSRIRLRLVSRNLQDRMDMGFWERRLRYAWQYRRQVLSEEELGCCRLIFGEADQFPGLTVDRFEDVLVVQNSCFGMEILLEALLGALLGILAEDGVSIAAVYLRNDLPARSLEGLPTESAFLDSLTSDRSRTADLVIRENGIFYRVDVLAGQKTGFFLDQKRNRQAVQNLARGRVVLDCFSHSGSFALNALKGGARRCLSVDSSAAALELAGINFCLNAIEEAPLLRADVMKLLPALLERKKGPDWDIAAAAGPYDFIILDPPAFAKHRQAKEAALRGYYDLNLAAMRLLPRGGFLATASCSQQIDRASFEKTLRDAAHSSGKMLKQLFVGRQSPDHPVLWGVPETDYLKFYIFQML